MTFQLFVPDHAQGEQLPVLWWLSGLTCTHANAMEKLEYKRACAEHRVILVGPDTSPRGDEVPDDPAYDFGKGAGFYVDATQAPWSGGYRMYSYVSQELRHHVEAHFPVDPERVGIFGHSMGGHGALTIALRNPDVYRSVSAFAPIASPMRCPWGEKALSGYLGDDHARWRDYDATALIEDRGWRGPRIVVDQGTRDPFLESQLKPGLLEDACARAGVALDLRRRDGYDHSYYFIATFVEDHLRFHARELAA